MIAIKYRSADVDGLKIFYREAGAAGLTGAAIASRLPEREPHVPGSHPASRRSLPHRRTRPAGLRSVGHAGAEQVHLHIRPHRRRDRPLYRSDRPEALRDLRLRLWRADRLPDRRHPERITAIISQNGNAYEEGLSEGWNPIRAYWQEPSQANREALRAFLAPETTRWQYTHGVADEAMVSPDGLSLDNFYLARPGADEIQLDLFGDYKSNVALYPTFQNYFRTHKPPFLAVWGKNDPFFLPPGAEAFRRDIPGAVVRFFDTGHFALETHAAEIAATMREFLGLHI